MKKYFIKGFNWLRKNLVYIAWVGFVVIVFLGLPPIIRSCNEAHAKNVAERDTKQAEYDSLILTEKEKDYWMEVYSAAIRRGMWYPAREANSAIIELRKKGGEAK